MLNNKGKEIEIKLKFNNKNDIIELLQPEIKFVKKISVHDTYYGTIDTTMENNNDTVRIRRIKDGQKILTYKSKAQDKNNIWHRTELETEVSSAKITGKILEALGLKPLYEYINKKEYYSYQNMEIVFAEFTSPAELEFMEIEGKNEKEIRKLTDKLKNIAHEAGEEIFEIFDKARGKK